MNGIGCLALACATAVCGMVQAQSLQTSHSRFAAYDWHDTVPAYIGSGNSGNGFKFDGRISYDRLPQSIKFSSVIGNGLSYGAMYAPIENAGSAWSAGARYEAGSFSTGLAYTRLRHPAGIAALYPYSAVGVTAFRGQTIAVVDPFTGAVTDLYPARPLAMGSQSELSLGAQWKFGSVALTGNTSSTIFKGDGRSSTMRVFEIGGTAQLSPAWLSTVGYQRASFEEAAWHQLTAGVAYSLSSGTAVYVSGDYLQASGNTRGVAGYSFTPAGNNWQADVRMGIRMRF